jgi:hypothetical protein
MRQTVAGGLLSLLVGTLVALLPTACREDGTDEIPLPDLAPFDQQMSDRLESIAATASELRGLAENQEIAQGTITCEAHAAYIREVGEEARSEYEADFEALNGAFRLLNMVGPEEDVLEALLGITASDVLGSYSPDDDALVLISDTPRELTFEDEITLAHEYVHSFQDKAFDLGELLTLGEKEEEEKLNTEYVDTIPALVEGDATFFEGLYAEDRLDEGELDEGDLIESFTAPCEAAAPDEFPPAAVERYFGFPYQYGPMFVEVLYNDHGGWSAVNDAYGSPPKTEEQILHPEKYLAHEDPEVVSLPDISNELGEGWQQASDSVFGEFDVLNWLLSAWENEAPADDQLSGDYEFDPFGAAEGWGGGRVAMYTDPLSEGRIVLHIALSWDGTQDAEDFLAAFEEVVTLIDPEPTYADSSERVVAWDAPNEFGRAVSSGSSFQMMIAVNQVDLDLAWDAVQDRAGRNGLGRALGKSANLRPDR